MYTHKAIKQEKRHPLDNPSHQETSKEKKYKVTGINKLRRSGKSSTDLTDKANTLNAQLESVFTEETNFDPASLNLKPCLTPILEDIITNSVKKLLDKLIPSKAPGPEKMSPQVLKTLSSSFAPILKIIYTKSYHLGTILNDWKKADVAPICKIGAKTEPSNYRSSDLCLATFLWFLDDSKKLGNLIKSNFFA